MSWGEDKDARAFQCGRSPALPAHRRSAPAPAAPPEAAERVHRRLGLAASACPSMRRTPQVSGLTDRTRTSSPASTLTDQKLGASSVSVIGGTGASSKRSSHPLGAGRTSFSVTSTLSFLLSTFALYASCSTHSARLGPLPRSWARVVI